MKRIALTLFVALSLVSSLQAQWIEKTYALNDGWNSIWLSGDASYVDMSEILAEYPNISEVWRWNPNPDQVTFTTSPSQSTVQSDEWTVWKRNDVHEQVLRRMVGNSAYLIQSTGATSLVIKQRPLPPAAKWQISGANFLGFPALAKTPTFSSYFSSFPSANTTVLSPSSKIYKYIGGPLNASNPMQIAPNSETVNPDTAYWIQSATVGEFTAPLEYELASDRGLSFGRTLNSMIVGVTNRSTTSLTISVSLESSAPAPIGQLPVGGDVALTRRIFNSATNSYVESPIADGFSVSVPASGHITLEFGIDRSALTESDDFRASILRIRDSAKLTDVSLPVSARATTTAGLWIARALVTNVVSTSPNTVGSGVSRPFALDFLLHVDGKGAARLLSQAFTGRLVSTKNPVGISISEDTILSYEESNIPPQRYVSPQMPMVPYILGSGALTQGATVDWNIPIPFDDPTNPFVHAYHPDHDNLDPSFSVPLENGVESYSIDRSCSFTFTSTSPDGKTIPGWGTTILGGIYRETLTGLNSQPLHVEGTFSMRRISEIADIDLTPPAI